MRFHSRRLNARSSKLHGYGVFAVETDQQEQADHRLRRRAHLQQAKRGARRPVPRRRAASGCFASTATGAAMPPSAATSRASSTTRARPNCWIEVDRQDHLDLGARRKPIPQGPGADLRLQHRGRQGDSLPLPAGLQDQAMKTGSAPPRRAVAWPAWLTSRVDPHVASDSSGARLARVASGDGVGARKRAGPRSSSAICDPRDRREARPTFSTRRCCRARSSRRSRWSPRSSAASSRRIRRTSCRRVGEGRRPDATCSHPDLKRPLVAGRGARVFLQRFLRLARAAVAARGAECHAAWPRVCRRLRRLDADGDRDRRTCRAEDDAARAGRRDGAPCRRRQGQAGADASRDQSGVARGPARRCGIRHRVGVQVQAGSALGQDRHVLMPSGAALGLGRRAHAGRKAHARGIVVAAPGGAGIDAAAFAAELSLQPQSHLQFAPLAPIARLGTPGTNTLGAQGTVRLEAPRPSASAGRQRMAVRRSRSTHPRRLHRAGAGGRGPAAGRRCGAAGARHHRSHLRAGQSQSPSPRRLRSLRHDALPGRQAGDRRSLAVRPMQPRAVLLFAPGAARLCLLLGVVRAAVRVRVAGVARGHRLPLRAAAA